MATPSEEIQDRVKVWTRQYEDQLVRGAAQAFDGALLIYLRHLRAESPNIVTRPEKHPFSRDVTRNIYTITHTGPLSAILTNPRLRKLGDRQFSPQRRQHRPLPVAPSRKEKRNGNEDVSGYINRAYNKRGAFQARGYRQRGIPTGTPYHRHAWNRGYAELRRYCLQVIAQTRGAANG